jgi:hypothetical protein
VRTGEQFHILNFRFPGWQPGLYVLGSMLALVCLFDAVVAVAAQAEPAAPELISAADLSRLSLEELTQVEISSIPKKLEPMGNAPAAI